MVHIALLSHAGVLSCVAFCSNKPFATDTFPENMLMLTSEISAGMFIEFVSAKLLQNSNK